ncbi:phosphonate C-P lyase system protein PhnH [Deinococcus sp.]|uniref:phosphonate C-P lyase system protein PhnH n=1 Tax=Deinococcus sp. TaxID=47478 RepID=UPI0025BA4A2E|nr:phosphonate C-P lyase system protein PhnH [Deinococcus sp.]
MATPVQTPFEAKTQEVFTALLWALSRPGEVQAIPAGDDAFALIGETLLDLESSFYTPDETLRERLLLTGAPHVPATEAEYLFFSVWNDDAREAIRQARRGDALYPDRAATLVLPAGFSGQVWVWRGPGINGEAHMSVTLPDDLAELREEAVQYPLGWDAFLVGECRVMGLPRTTQIEVTPLQPVHRQPVPIQPVHRQEEK